MVCLFDLNNYIMINVADLYLYFDTKSKFISMFFLILIEKQYDTCNIVIIYGLVYLILNIYII